MDVDEFLALRGADLPSAITAIERKLGFGDEQLVLAVGSLVEGLGNSKSDLDVLFIAAESPARPPGPVTVVVGRCLIDVCVLALPEVLALLERFELWVNRPWDVTHSATFTIAERTLLHRLRHGRCLHESRDSVVARRLPSVADLARLKLHAARQNARTIQVDMVGNRDAGDYRSLVFASQELLGQAVDALVAGYHLTNPLIKWRSRMLELLPEDWLHGLAVRPSGASAADHVWRLYRPPHEADAVSTQRYAAAVSTFARAVFAWAESVLLGWPPGTASVSWEEGKSNGYGRTLPLLDFDVDFSPRRDGAVLARLNEFGEPIELGSLEFTAALLFDGKTSEAAAAAAVHGPGGGGDEIAALVARMAGAELLAGSHPPRTIGSRQ